MIKFFSVVSFVLICSFSTYAQNYITHPVKAGETIEGIAKRYNVSVNDIYGLNPEAKKTLKPNTVLIIPVSKTATSGVTTTKELDGFKTHKVARKETLYGIAKQYNVTEDDIKKYNTFLYSSTLNKGDNLRIPVYKEVQKVTDNTTKSYTVQAKETKWGIAYKFGISVGELESLNPQLGPTLQEGQQINVPNIEKKAEKVITAEDTIYEVLPQEGFYRLKVKLGLTQEELEALNPGLKETGLKAGMILKVPAKGGITAEGPKTNLSTRVKDNKTKHIAVMLPFRLNRINFDSVPAVKSNMQRDRYLQASIDFHSGILMALDSLKKLGVSLKVDVYDTKYEVSEVSKIIRSNDFKSVDAVIGPLTPNNFETAATELRALNVPVISLIGTNLQLKDNEFQSLPSDDILKARIINHVKSTSQGANVVIISDSESAATSNELKKEFPNARQIYSRKNKEGKDSFFVTIEDIRPHLKPGKNIVFLETKNIGLISSVTSLLNSLYQNGNREENNEGIRIVLTTTNKNAAFEDDEINNTHLSALHFMFASNSKSYSDTDNNAFVKAYTKLYNITPNKRATRGFDLTMDVVLRLATAKDMYESANEVPLTEYVENKFSYKRKSSGGYYNDSAYILKYQDLNIVEINNNP
jgi:LysM repeat protein